MNLSNPAVKKAVLIGGLILLFLFSFVFFLYLTFPYEVLKESLAAQVSGATGYSIQIGELGPRIPLGIKAKSVRIESPSGASAIKLDRVTVAIGILPLLIGRLSVDTEVENGAGSLELGLRFGLLGLMKGAPLPRHVTLSAISFPIDDFTRFGLASAGGGGANPMLSTMLATIGMNGKLNGVIDFALDADDATQSKGQAELKINGAALTFSDATIGLPDQIFTKALIKAKMDSGTLVIDNTSGFVAEELEISLDGKVSVKAVPTASQLNMKVGFKLHKGLKEKFGFLIDAILGRASADGQLTMQILGTLAEPAVSTF